jgi:RNA recognition motif-containing protein
LSIKIYLPTNKLNSIAIVAFSRNTEALLALQMNDKNINGQKIQVTLVQFQNTWHGYYHSAGLDRKANY